MNFALPDFLRRVLAREIAEAGEFGLELQLDRPRRAVALLADDDFRLPVRAIHLALPLGVLWRAHARFFVFEIIFFAIDEEDDVGVLFDRS